MAGDVQGGGNRPDWDHLPSAVRDRIESLLGARVISSDSALGGFSPGFASAVETEDGERMFVKAISDDLAAGAADLYRAEARNVAALPAGTPSANLRRSDDDGHWIVLVYDLVDGAAPIPSRPDELTLMLETYSSLAAAVTAYRDGLPSFEESWAWRFDLWDEADEDRPIADGDEFGWAFDNLALLRKTARGWRDAVDGASMLHGDLRADNMILTPDRNIVVVDWPEACSGAPWLDLILALPSIGMFPGTPPLDSILTSHPLTAEVDSDRLDTVVAAMAGFFGIASTMSPMPGLPTLRRFQRDQASEAFKLLAARLDGGS